MPRGEDVAWIETISDPPGPFTFAVDAQGRVLWLQFADGDYAADAAEVLAGHNWRIARDPARTAEARAELLAYCQGTLRAFSLPLALPGTPWQLAVWQAVCAIPFGETRTYGEIAASLGKPRAARAMGRANAMNPLPILVPCHRVVGASGALTGYAGGVHLKRRLLDHEARVLAIAANASLRHDSAELVTP